MIPIRHNQTAKLILSASISMFVMLQIVNEMIPTEPEMRKAPLENIAGPSFGELPVAVSLLLIGVFVGFAAGLLPIPVGYERGKVKWVMWCGTGMHAHIVYWTGHGFQTLHPADRSETV